MAWMSEEAAATVLGVTFRTIRRRVGNGSLRAMRQGRQIFVDIEVARIPSPTQQQDAPAAVLAPPSTPVIAAPQLEPLPLKPAAVNESHVASRPAIEPAGMPAIAANTIDIASLPTLRPAPLPAGAVPVTPREMRSRSLAGVLIWLLLTLFISASVAAGWIYHLGMLRLHEAEGRCQQTVQSAQQAQAEHEKQIAAQAAAASARENTLTTDLGSSGTRLDETHRKLVDQQNAAAALRDELKVASSRLANMQTERQALAQKLTTSQASVQLLRWRATLSDAVKELAARLPRPAVAAQETHFKPTGNPSAQRAEAEPSAAEDIYATRTGAAAHDSATGDTADSPSIRRLLPYQPPTLGQEDAKAALRPIVRPGQ